MAGQPGTTASGIISADAAFAALGRHIDDLAQIPFRAWERYRADIAPAMAAPPKRLRSTAMQALMVAEMEAAFGGEVRHRKGRSLLCTVPGLVVQCKKLDARGQPQNYPTETAVRFAYQVPIPGIPPGTRLTLGYMLNTTGTAIAEVRLLAQNGKGVEWFRELTVGQIVISIMAPNTITIPARIPARTVTIKTPPSPTPPPTKKRTLQPKGAAEAKAKKERKPGA
jgi:hypothetical protein